MLKRNSLVSLLVLVIMVGCGDNKSNPDNKLTSSEKFDRLSENISIDELSLTYYNEKDEDNISYNNDYSLAYTGNNKDIDKKIDEITQKLKIYKQKELEKNKNKVYNKTSDLENKLNIYFLSLKEEFNSDVISSGNFQKVKSTFDGYLQNRLNRIEYKLYKSDPVKALLCMGNGKLAYYYSESHYHDYVLEDGNGDAFRHALWNYGMSQDVGTTFAKKFADAHEDGVKNNPRYRKGMDLYNNRVGRELSKKYAWTISQMIDRTKKAVRSGKMVTTDHQSYYWSNSYGEK